jgi:hypothetical protein
LRTAIARRILPQVAAAPEVVAAHLLAAEIDASHVDTAESRTRTFDVPPFVVLVEATTAAAAGDARTAFDGEMLASFGATVRPDGAVYALEICRLAAAIADADGATSR